MYRIEDKVSATKELQRMLKIRQSGYYDEQTKESVLSIQHDHGLSETGRVDYETFKTILERYRRQRISSRHSDYLFNPTFPYKENAIGKDVELINSLLQDVLIDYGYENSPPAGKFLGKSTLESANFLRRIFRMNPSDEIDALFINRLLLEKRAMEIKTGASVN